MRGKAFEDLDTPYQEFMWGDYFRTFMSRRLIELEFDLAAEVADEARAPARGAGPARLLGAALTTSVRSILAIAVGFLSTLPACAAVSTLQLQSPPPVGKKAVAMPLIANPSDDAERRINVALKRLDANLRKAIRDGKGNDNGPGGWVRKSASQR